MKKTWYQVIDFYRLTGLTLIWIASWIFMLPCKTDITSPFYNNIWGALFAMFGATVEKTVEAQQTPDLVSGVVALCVITILKLRGILSLTNNVHFSQADSKRHKALIILLDLISIIVHTLFFTMLVKIFLFPDKGVSSLTEQVQTNIKLLVFTAVCVTAMVVGAASLAKLFMILFVIVSIFLNVNFVSNAIGIWGFVAILMSASGFYLEFCHDTFNKKTLLLDAAFLAGKYDRIEYKSAEKETNQ